MKTRITSAFVALILLFVVLLSGKLWLGIAIMFIAMIGLFEFYNSIASAGYRPIRSVGYLSCVALLFLSINEYSRSFAGLFIPVNFFSLSVFIIILILFCSMVLNPKKHNLIDISLTIFAIFYVIFLISFVILTRNLEHGEYYIWLVFIGAFATDTFAFFAGKLIGKVKILPEISPKKTVEGSIGGVIGCVVITMTYGLIINKYIGNIHIINFLMLGLLNGIISQIGDWSASAVKRFVNVKDFGKIMPGHGGVLDRMDSILFVAPTVYFYINLVVLKLGV